MAKWKCRHCGFIYDEDEGCEDYLIDPGTKWEDIPDDWLCPDCGSPKQDFEPYED